MTGKTHAAAGICAGATFALLAHAHPAISVGAALAGGLAPDVDTFRSPAARQVRRIQRGLAAAVLAVGAAGTNPQGLLRSLGISRSMALQLGLGANSQVSALIAFVIFFLLLVAGSLCAHRGPTHSLVALGALSTTLGFVSPTAGLAFGLGYATHLALDMLTYQKLNLFWPLAPKGGGVSLKLTRTGGPIDALLLAGFTLASALMLGLLGLGSLKFLSSS